VTCNLLVDPGRDKYKKAPSLNGTLKQVVQLKVLVIEDETGVAEIVSAALREVGYEVVWARTGCDGLSALLVTEFDVAVLDIMLPDIDGFTVLAEARKKLCKTPILMLSAHGAVEDRVKGLDLGADDSLSMPFDLQELIARIKALMRRPLLDLSWLTVGDLTLEPLERRVKRGKRHIDLTAREFSLLEYLWRNWGKVVSRSEIMSAVWGDSEADSNVIPVYINYLRSKIESVDGPQLIHTARGVGYILEIRDKKAR